MPDFDDAKNMAEMKSTNSSIQIYDEARLYFEAGRYQEAIRILKGFLNNSEYRLRSLKNISSCLMRLGNGRAALKFAELAISEDHEYAPAHLNKAEILAADGNLEEASKQFRFAIDADPSLDLAWRRLTEVLCSLDKIDEALKTAQEWTSNYNLSITANCTKGALYLINGMPQEAVASFRHAIRLDPENASAYEYLFMALSELSLFDEALSCITIAAKLSPTSFVIACQKGFLHWHLSQTEEAKSAFLCANAIDATSAIAYLNYYLIMPAVPSCRQEIEEYHQRFLNGLQKAEAHISLLLDFSHVSISHTFYLAYHNTNVRGPIERYINLMRKLVKPILAFSIPSEEHSSNRRIMYRKDQKVRIGFLSQNFGSHSNALAFNGLIKHLNRQLFYVVLIHTGRSKKTHDRDQLDQSCNQSLQLSTDLAEVASQLHRLDLDIIYFTDLGMNPYEYIIPFLKVAPVQFTGWGVPHTSGIKEIDYYISADDLQPEGAESQFTEQLIRLPGGLPCCFLTDGVNVPNLPRDYFLLPPDDLLIGCLQSIHKLHPDFDSILEDIAIKNPDLIFVFTEDPVASRTHQFVERLARNAPTVSRQCLFLALMSRNEYQSLCRCMDILLDPIYFGSGITFFEASLTGTPIVTLEGDALRSRVVCCGYRQMGISDPPIATSSWDYIQLVTSLVNDIDRRERMRTSILANNHRIFNRIDYVRNFEEICISKVNERMRLGPGLQSMSAPTPEDFC